ncbi:hypothetical protein C1645_815024 [Glomus cerebriforme]|uniref:Uncharacterized protein n=1 Tax=Glomus cerebriforme TaxID=658196 RepID=A0A397TEM9_9GLOM|nr:hypothetical protein C1645_815024 [Glomus cerebriforme]
MTSLRNLNLAQVLQLNFNEFKLFYQPPDDNNFYHVTFIMILQSFPQICDDDYDYEFFSENYYVKCKLLSHYSIVNILNKEVYGIDFDANSLKHKYVLTIHQKYNLDLRLKQILLSRDSSDSYTTSNSETSKISQSSMNMNASVQTQTITTQLIQDDQPPLQLNEFKFFYKSPGDDNYYHVTCKIILQDYPHDNYDYEFFYLISNDSTIRYHVTCKLLSHTLIINLLNKKIYGRDFDPNDLKRQYTSLTSHQKLNLELNLKQVLPYYLCIPEKEINSNSNENVHENMEINMTQVDSP